jgi:hypothetical protein
MNAIWRHAAIAALLALTCAGAAQAAIKDYEFQLIEKQIRKGEGAIVVVRLIYRRTGKAVPDALIIAKRIDMAPDGMETMTSPVEVLPSTQQGIYRFRTNLTMEGGWQLSLGAKVQGETGTVVSKLVLEAVK